MQEARTLFQPVPYANRASEVLQLLWKTWAFGSSVLREASRRGEGSDPEPEHAEGPDIDERSWDTSRAGGEISYACSKKVGEQEVEKVLMKCFASGEPVQKQVRFEEGSGKVQDQSHVQGAARIRRRPVFTPNAKPYKKTNSFKQKDTRQKSPIQALVERAERYYFLESLGRTPAGIMFGQIGNRVSTK